MVRVYCTGWPAVLNGKSRDSALPKSRPLVVARDKLLEAVVDRFFHKSNSTKTLGSGPCCPKHGLD